MMPDLHFEIFPAAQSELWHSFEDQADVLKEWEFYLAGGSALALQIGHRQSVDFDFFSKKKGMGEAIQEWLRQFPDVIIRDSDTNTVHAEVQGVKVSLIGGYRYPTVDELVVSEDLRLACILDIGLMKLLSITHRAVLRDYLDLAVIIRDHIPLKILCDRSMEKYGSSFNLMMPLRTLVSFTDLDEEMPVLMDSTLKNEWQKILTEAVRDIILPSSPTSQ